MGLGKISRIGAEVDIQCRVDIQGDRGVGRISMGVRFNMYTITPTTLLAHCVVTSNYIHVILFTCYSGLDALTTELHQGT